SRTYSAPKYKGWRLHVGRWLRPAKSLVRLTGTSPLSPIVQLRPMRSFAMARRRPRRLYRGQIFASVAAEKTGSEQAIRRLAVASQKTGAGKPTLAGHIAIQAQRAGTKPVVLVDLDPDSSLADWFALREEDDEPLPVARANIKDLPTILQQLRAAGAALVVLDTPP